MAKNVGARLSRKLKQKMQIVGGKLSCLDCVVILVWHRLLGILLVPLEMVPRIEKRFSTASIGIYLQVSYALRIATLYLAKDDEYLVTDIVIFEFLL